MPSENGRSMGYRPMSFLSCSDPKGVEESRTIRKRNSESKKTAHRKNSGKERMSLPISNQEEREVEISRGARGHNRAIDSWSEMLSIHRGNEEISRELLEGAIDLQESLARLKKLQSASIHVIDQTHNPPADVLSKRWARETEALARQDRLLKTEDDAEHLPHSTTSTSSYGFSSSDHSSTSTAISGDRRTLSLVARLMGLEDMPTPDQNQNRNQRESSTGEVSNCKRHASPIVLIRPMRSRRIGKEGGGGFTDVKVEGARRNDSESGKLHRPVAVKVVDRGRDSREEDEGVHEMVERDWRSSRVEEEEDDWNDEGWWRNEISELETDGVVVYMEGLLFHDLIQSLFL